MLKSSLWIKKQAEKFKLIEPFIPKSVREGVISYGLGPYGYDIRLDKTYKKIKDNLKTIDPHNIKEEFYETLNEEKIIMAPGSCILGKSLEYLGCPKRFLALFMGNPHMQEQASWLM